ncbi:MAG: DUF6932 family protein [Saprospiraceae bacterium]
MLQFDDFGYLTPYETHVLSLEDFERTFVIDTEREKLFRLLTDLVLDLKNLGAGTFYIWVDGSFVTKKRVPKDIDLVVFVNYRTYKLIDEQRLNLQERFEPQLDMFIVEDFPEEHSDYSLTVFDKLRWQGFFGFDRAFRNKGFVQLNF